MRHSITAALVLFVLGMSGTVHAQEPMAVVKKFVDSFNKGDASGAAATHATGPDLTIVDEVAPFHWRGADAFKAWSAALEADAKKRGITEQLVTIKAASRTEMEGDQAYLVVPATYTFKEKGVPMREVAQFTFVVKKNASGWLIHSWTWTGPKPSKG